MWNPLDLQREFSTLKEQNEKLQTENRDIKEQLKHEKQKLLKLQKTKRKNKNKKNVQHQRHRGHLHQKKVSTIK